MSKINLHLIAKRCLLRYGFLELISDFEYNRLLVILWNYFIVELLINNEWLEECVAWCRGEVLGASYTIDQLKNATHDQWLLLDLRDIESPVLPSGLSEKKYMLLNGNFSLQVMQVVDISKPKYWQIQQIRRENILTKPQRNESYDSVGSGKRVLQLSLTDGVQYVEAIEYKPINVLDINLTPGIKVRLSGPITIRRGQLMLQEKNIRILGGEVESLLVSNAAENILAKALNLPENPDPQVVDMNLLTVDQEDDNTQNNIIQLEANSRNMHNSNGSTSRNSNTEHNQLSKVHFEERNTCSTTNLVQVEEYPTDEDFEMLMQAENLLDKKENKNPIITQRSSTKNDDCKNKVSAHYEEEIELLMEVEREFDGNKKNNRNKTPDLFQDDFNLDEIDHLMEVTNKSKNEQSKSNFNTKASVQIEKNASLERSCITKHTIHRDIQQASSQPSNIPKANLFDEFINEDDLFSNMDIDHMEKRELPEVRSNIISITELLRHIQQTNCGSFKVHAKFKSIVEKLTLQKQEYKLTIMIQDESNEVICRVHSDVISKWAGLTPAEIMNLKTNIFSQDIESKKKVEKALQNIKDLLIDINHVMEIEIIGKELAPTITNIIY